MGDMSTPIVLKHSNLGEADRILTLFTPHKGKVHVIAKGIHRITSTGGLTYHISGWKFIWIPVSKVN